jgi:hypothetical protein
LTVLPLILTPSVEEEVEEVEVVVLGRLAVAELRRKLRPRRRRAVSGELRHGLS